LRNMRIV